jgi:SPP1 family predicted phage head-tail adaptor
MARIGDFRENIRLQRKTLTADAAGQPQETWIDVAAVKGAVDSLGGREVFNAAQAGVIATTKVTIWYRQDVHANAGTWRLLLCGDRTLNIVAALPSYKPPRQLELICSEAFPWPNQQ